MATGQERGFFVVEKFQSLKGLEIEVLNKVKKQNAFHFEVILRNKNSNAIEVNHVSKPVLAVMQDRTEIAAIPLFSALNQQKIEPQEEVTVTFSVPKEKIEPGIPVTIYTRSKENIRGEIISISLN
jgi:hypothetical protein